MVWRLRQDSSNNRRRRACTPTRTAEAIPPVTTQICHFAALQLSTLPIIATNNNAARHPESSTLEQLPVSPSQSLTPESRSIVNTMLSSLASYLLGGGAAAAAETHSPAEALIPPAAVDADDGWVLVDSVEGSCADSTFVDLRLTVSAVTTAAPTTGTTGQVPLSNATGARGRRRGSRVEPRPLTPATTPDAGDEGGNSTESESTAAANETGACGDAGAATPAGLRSRSSSSASLPCLLVDESWYVTPPPCFTSTGPVHMETSPLEDLLIEHPSMSVYHQHPRAAPGPVPAVSTPLPLPPAPSPATGAAAAPSAVAARPRAGSLPPPEPVPVAPPAARGAGAIRLQEQQGLQLKTAQKVQQRRATQALKRGPLGRQNKARECNGRNKVLRRSDRMLQHSGANNNRKC